ncbi:DUF2442 domain-containing protein [Candidatus Venteria ishoeyi]|uniref:DUF2442 domain-containing protein n=1 Tax=Candidatus Venteria ishoeyi TaxID=1899563 RepID=A0A1H6FC86_9GAMM|nr:DUF2442 domain-containing protein [Candidatus Venteria ishoeyi]SEH06625.1 Uncharacterised protein [Candidatus Venteria ishoeyi]
MNSAVNTPWVKPVKVVAHKNYHLDVVMEDEREFCLDLSGLINRRQIFWRLKNSHYFKQVNIDPLGGLCWPEGEDISPEKILHYVVT